MRTCKVSILGGGIARDLLNGLKGKAVDYVSDRDMPQATFHLRRAYQYRRGGWDGHTYQTSKTATGGMVAWFWPKGMEQSYCAFGRAGRMLRIHPSQVGNAERILNVWVTATCKAITEERYRLNAVDQLDRICAPYVKIEAFADWVTEQEKVLGESSYSKLSVEDCAKWTDLIRQWAHANKQPFNVNPTGQVSVGWHL